MSGLDPPSVRPDAPKPEDAAERLIHCMRHLHRLVSARLMGTLRSEMQDEEVNFTQMTALYKVRASAPLSVSMLAEQLGVSLPATSQLLQELVRRKLIERDENPDNRREKLLSLSEKGQQFLSTKEQTMMEAYREVFGRVRPATLRRAEAALRALLAEASQPEPGTDCCPARPTPPTQENV